MSRSTRNSVDPNSLGDGGKSKSPRQQERNRGDCLQIIVIGFCQGPTNALLVDVNLSKQARSGKFGIRRIRDEQILCNVAAFPYFLETKFPIVRSEAKGSAT